MVTDVRGQEDKPRQWQKVLKPEDWYLRHLERRKLQPRILI